MWTWNSIFCFDDICEIAFVLIIPLFPSSSASSRIGDFRERGRSQPGKGEKNTDLKKSRFPEQKYNEMKLEI